MGGKKGEVQATKGKRGDRGTEDPMIYPSLSPNMRRLTKLAYRVGIDPSVRYVANQARLGPEHRRGK